MADSNHVAERIRKPFGEWQSPITSDFIVQGSVRLSSLQVEHDDVFWVEGRPSNEGRYTVVHCTFDGEMSDVTNPKTYNARSAVHEYGGGAMTVYRGKAFFVNWDDQRVYVKRVGSRKRTKPVTPQIGKPADRLVRFADLHHDPAARRLFAVRETHDKERKAEPVNTIVAVRTRSRRGSSQSVLSLDGIDDETTLTGSGVGRSDSDDRLPGIDEKSNSGNGDNDGGKPSGTRPVMLSALGEFEVTTVASGHDFYAAPRVSPRGDFLAYVAWDHPNMPWDNVFLYVRPLLGNGEYGDEIRVAGFEQEESIVQPLWSPDGKLYFITDRTNWWNIYVWDPFTKATTVVHQADADFGFPHWVFGARVFDFVNESTIVCAPAGGGFATIDVNSGELTRLPTQFTSISDVRVADHGIAYFIGGSASLATCVVRYDLNDNTEKIIRRSTTLDVPPELISVPRSITFPTTDGQVAHGQFYEPANALYHAPTGEKPPLLVKIHGGPTGSCTKYLRLDIQYWTSRGWAVLDVDYRGSTGYGRAYRKALAGKWGIYDVDDCCMGAQYLVDQGLVDGNRLAITGGSAGGYTTLAALTFRDTFHVGASHFGVGDLEALAKDTHKFESRYLDGLVGPYPDAVELYHERSPVYHVDKLKKPLALFQGLEDRIVPPNQAEAMYAAVKKLGLPVTYVAFEGEQHGFRQAKNIRAALDGEFYFYSRIFGFKQHIDDDDFVPPHIDNIDDHTPPPQPAQDDEDESKQYSSDSKAASSSAGNPRRLRNIVLFGALVALAGAWLWKTRPSASSSSSAASSSSALARAPAILRRGADYVKKID